MWGHENKGLGNLACWGLGCSAPGEITLRHRSCAGFLRSKYLAKAWEQPRGWWIRPGGFRPVVWPVGF